ncbi:class I SAM-dependent methyltransferase [Actinopolymorpha sp. B11F2]|uniref:O-methyltransferase n=1 Tax=Actinopolymorpha sp. B11F2 TaxID=3160862 RepID=UPI0032E437D6
MTADNDNDFPALVREALAAARDLRFPTSRDEADGRDPSCSLPDAGRVLAMLAAGCQDGRIGETGTGTGVGTAWMASAMPASATLVTVEFDDARAQAAAKVFRADSRVRVVHGDAQLVLADHAPYDLLFVDGGWTADDATVDLLRIGGRVVFDDVTPHAALPADSPLRKNDPKRDFFFGNLRLVSVEVVFPDLANSLLVGTRTA